MIKKDYYEVLALDKTAGSEDIKKAYRQMAMAVHPDRKPDDPQAEEKIKEINEAYAVLSDPQKRQLYDTYGHQGLKGYTEEDLFRSVDFSSLFKEFGIKNLFGFGDPFGSFFGGRSSSHQGPQKGADLRYDLSITLEEAAFGAEKTFQFPREETCPTCRGTGALPGGLEPCDQCHGSGQIVTKQKKGSSLFRQIRTCSQCLGRGQIIKQPCPECQGHGVIQKSQEISITIPRGANQDHVITLEREGRPGKDYPGDLHVVLDILKHPIFERHGDDLFLEQEVPFNLAILGGQTEIPKIEGGTAELKVPEGTQTGTHFRLDGLGVPHLNGPGRGDTYVFMKVAIPTALTKRQKRLIREFEKLEKEKSFLFADSHPERDDPSSQVTGVLPTEPNSQEASNP